MLHSHPRIAIPPENRFVVPAYRERRRFGDLRDAANRRALAKFIVGRGRGFGDLGLDRPRTVRQIVAGPPTLGSAIGIVLRAYAERFGRPRWGDKRPEYHRYIDVILRLFPDAQIVHVVRDPRDCVASLKQMPWWKTSAYHAVSTWANSIAYTDAAARKWPGVVTRVQYERLVADPEKELRALCASLGEAYDPTMAEPERVARVAVPDRKHWHGNTRVSVTTGRVGRWEGGLEPWELALCETVLADRMTRFGYEPSGLARASARHLVSYAGVHAARRARRHAWALRDRYDRAREPNPVAAVLTASQRALAAA